MTLKLFIQYQYTYLTQIKLLMKINTIELICMKDSTLSYKFDKLINNSAFGYNFDQLAWLIPFGVAGVVGALSDSIVTAV